MGRRQGLIALVLGLVLLPLVVLGPHVVSARVVLIAVCVTALTWVGASAALLTLRRDWPALRRFLFTWNPGIRGGPVAFWAILALLALIRVLA